MNQGMNQDCWTAVEDYITGKLLPFDPAQNATLRTNAEEGLPAIDVAPNEGKLLHLLARVQGARRILEIGTLGGYSTIWLAQALPADGWLLSLEFEPKHAEVARRNIARAGLSDRVEVRVGAAAESLAQLAEESTEPFDFIFIDADKPNNPAYLRWALHFSRVGTVIVCDNVVREGEIVDADSTDPRVQGTQRLFEMLSAEPRLTATAVQTVGSKGYDGFAMALVVA